MYFFFVKTFLFFLYFFFFFSSRRRHTRWPRDWSSDVCSSDLEAPKMASPTTNFIRRIILLGNGLTFLLLGAYVLFATHKAAYFYGYTLNGVDGLNEFRAVYIGFWFGLTILFFTAARRPNIAMVVDLAL